MELVPMAEFTIVTRSSSSAWIPELIAAAGPEVTETYGTKRGDRTPAWLATPSGKGKYQRECSRVPPIHRTHSQKVLWSSKRAARGLSNWALNSTCTVSRVYA
jgi:hypothetical protein